MEAENGHAPAAAGRVVANTYTVPWQGCSLHRIHLPKPVRTHKHHIFPMYLQTKKYGSVLFPETVDVCPTGHDDVHAAIAAIFMGKPIPKGVGRQERAMAMVAVRRFLEK